MPHYTDPERHYSMEYPSRWLPLTGEGTPHVSFASLTTGGCLRIEAYRFEQPAETVLPALSAVQKLIESDRHRWAAIGTPRATTASRRGLRMATTTYTRPETPGRDEPDLGLTRIWILNQSHVQVRCVYRCRRVDATVDDGDLEAMMDSLALHPAAQLDAGNFGQYYHCVLKRHRPQLAVPPLVGLTLVLPDGQTILLESLYRQYQQQPDRLDELIEKHIDLLDYCGDDVPDLGSYQHVRPLLFPKLARVTGLLPSHRLPLWPGLAVTAVVQGTVFHYGVNSERLRLWGVATLGDLWGDLLANLQRLPPAHPRGQRNELGQLRAVTYVDHPFSASFVMGEDFYAMTAQTLGCREFLIGLPEPGYLSCFREDDARFTVEHAAQLRGAFHGGVEQLTDVIYVVNGPTRQHVRPYDVLHCCAR